MKQYRTDMDAFLAGLWVIWVRIISLFVILLSIDLFARM